MYAFFEFKIKVRLRRSAWQGYQWCVRKWFLVQYEDDSVIRRRTKKPTCV